MCVSVCVCNNNIKVWVEIMLKKKKKQNLYAPMIWNPWEVLRNITFEVT